MSKRITIADLEFDQIKQNLKEFLKGQSQFSDYNFEGSNLSILLDVLAYNTHYNAMYTNMALNEAFLDSASRRDSVVSHATALGYTPRSSRAARVYANFSVTGVTPDIIGVYPNFITLPRYSEFNGTKDGVRYTFYTTQPITAAKTQINTYSFTNVELVEGAFVTNRFEYTDQNSFIIPNQNIDTSTLIVKVQPNPNSSDFDNFVLSTNVPIADGTSLIYFMREFDGFYTLSFGDDIIGKKLTQGNIITLDYFVCSGEGPNGITLITYSGGSLEGGTVTGITINAAVSGGRNQETIEQIRFNAPNIYAAQNRAVSAIDYESLILSKVPSIQEVAVWGGENNTPPQYGKVFISAKTVNGRDLTFAEQQQIVEEVIEPYKVVSVIPEFVNPDYIQVELDIVAYYDNTTTNATEETIRTSIVSSILAYDTNELQKFNKILRRSVISRLVESVDTAIISSVPRMKMHRLVTPFYNKDTNYTINIGTPFTPNTIKSTGVFIKNFPTACFIDDNGSGVLTLYTFQNGVRRNLRTSGTVDYDKGILNILDLNIVKIADQVFKFIITPASADIASMFNQIVLLDRSLLKVAVVVDETTKGRALSGNKYQFTKSSI